MCHPCLMRAVKFVRHIQIKQFCEMTWLPSRMQMPVSFVSVWLYKDRWASSWSQTEREEWRRNPYLATRVCWSLWTLLSGAEYLLSYDLFVWIIVGFSWASGYLALFLQFLRYRSLEINHFFLLFCMYYHYHACFLSLN